MLNYNIQLHGLDDSLTTDYVEKIVFKKFSRMNNFFDKTQKIRIDLYKEKKLPEYKMTISGFLNKGQEFNFKERGNDLRNLIDTVCNKAKENIKEESKRPFKKSVSRKRSDKRKYKDEIITNTHLFL